MNDLMRVLDAMGMLEVVPTRLNLPEGVLEVYTIYEPFEELDLYFARKWRLREGEFAAGSHLCGPGLDGLRRYISRTGFPTNLGRAPDDVDEVVETWA